MPNSAEALYRPGTPLGTSSMPLDMAIPGMLMCALARAAPASTSACEPARLNSTTKALRPLCNVPFGARNVISRSPDLMV
jgi:hypothetical protein